MIDYKSQIRVFEDYPIKGVSFKDIWPLFFRNYSQILDDFANLFDKSKFDYVVGVETRGLVLAAGLAAVMGKGLIPIRKFKENLPGERLQAVYKSEYGIGSLAISLQSYRETDKVILIDDVLATGNTLKAAISLVKDAGLNLVDIGVLINLRYIEKTSFLMRRNAEEIKHLISYDS